MVRRRRSPSRGPGCERSGWPCACPLPQSHPRPAPGPGGLWDAGFLRGPGRGKTNGWGRRALGEKAFSSDPRGCLGVPEPPAAAPLLRVVATDAGWTTVACRAEPPLSARGPPAPRWGRASLSCLPRPAPPPSESGEDPAGPRPASGAWGSRVRAGARAAAFSRCVSPEGWGAPLRVPLPCAVRVAVCWPPPAPAPSRRRRRRRWWWCGHGSGRSRLGGRFPRVVAPGRTGRMEVRTGPRGGGPVGLGPSGVGAWFAGGGSPRVLRPAGVPGRRGTALVLVAVGSRARLPGGLARVFVGAPFPPESLSYTLSGVARRAPSSPSPPAPPLSPSSIRPDG